MTNNDFQLIDRLLRVKTYLKRDHVKRVIGDSTNNHRSLTVRQIIRYLSRTNASSGEQELATQLETFYNSFGTENLYETRTKFNNRSDALDVKGFLDSVAVINALEG